MQAEVSQWVEELGMQSPAQVSGQTHNGSPVYSTLIQAALSPAKNIPQTPAVKVHGRLDNVSQAHSLLASCNALAACDM